MNVNEDGYVNSTPAQKGVWWRLIRNSYAQNKRMFWIIIGLAFCNLVIDACYMLSTKFVVDEISANGKDADLVPFAWAYFTLMLANSWCVIQFIRQAGWLSVSLQYELRKMCFEHLQELSFSFYDNNAVGWLVARVTSDCARIARIIAWGTLDLFLCIPLILGLFSVLFYLDAVLAAYLLAVFPFIALVSVYFSKKILQTSRLIRRTNSRLTAVYNEGIAGVETSKILVREDENLSEFKKDTQEMYRLCMGNLMLSSTYYPLVTVLVSVGTGVAIWVGGFEVLLGVMTLGTLVAFVTCSRHLMHPLLETAEVLTNWQRVTASAERVMGLLEVKPAIVDTPQAKAMERQQDVEIQDIEFKHVSFAYKEEQWVLKDFNFKVKAGRTVALVGATGSGKSTIVNLLCRFYEPNKGDIEINGLDYRKRRLSWLQSNLGIVLQSPFLFSGTIRSNIRYGHLSATDEEVEAAAKKVKLHDIVMSMEQGYDTVVQEGGNNLSTGQKQLISFARAIIGNPQILVMDEATSSVDTQTEQRLQEGLVEVLQGRTSFIIAHRLSTIRNADDILVIDKGHLVEQGNHQSLLAKKGYYYRLYSQQFQSEQQETLNHNPQLI